MPIRKYKPTTSTRRFQSVSTFEEVTRDRPHKALTHGRTATGGRNCYGRVTSRFRGGGHKRRYRVIDFRRRDKDGVPARVEAIEYDPNRSGRIALLCYADGERRYILAPEGLAVGQIVMSGPDAEHRVGNCLPLRAVLEGTMIHAIEFKIGKGAAIARSAGTSAQVVGKEGDYALVRMPSSEVRRIHLDCRATIGQTSNLEHENISIGKAGRKRWMGRRPHNRGVSMNPVDHPLGGGEGRTSGGRHPVSPWGQPCKGYKTRRRKDTSKMIIRRRGKKS